MQHWERYCDIHRRYYGATSMLRKRLNKCELCVAMEDGKTFCTRHLYNHNRGDFCAVCCSKDRNRVDSVFCYRCTVWHNPERMVYLHPEVIDLQRQWQEHVLRCGVQSTGEPPWSSVIVIDKTNYLRSTGMSNTCSTGDPITDRLNRLADEAEKVRLETSFFETFPEEPVIVDGIYIGMIEWTCTQDAARRNGVEQTRRGIIIGQSMGAGLQRWGLTSPDGRQITSGRNWENLAAEDLFRSYSNIQIWQVNEWGLLFEHPPVDTDHVA